MIVLITNITDVPKPGRKLRSRAVRIFNTEIPPGGSLRIDAKFVDAKMRKLEDAGWVSIGKVPPWYQDYKSSRAGKSLTVEQIRSLATPKKLVETKPEAEKPPAPAKSPPTFDLSDSVEPPSDEVTVKGSTRNKKKQRG